MGVLAIISDIERDSGGPSISVTSIVNELSSTNDKSCVVVQYARDPVPCEYYIVYRGCFWLRNFINSMKPEFIWLNGLWDPIIIKVLFLSLFGFIPGVKIIISPRGMLEKYSMQKKVAGQKPFHIQD